MTVLSLALDLGSTRVKAARLLEDGRLAAPVAEPAPPLSGEDPIREGDADAYRAAAERVLERAGGDLAGDVALGIASQRSSFLLWDRASGSPVTPFVSWQDRRAGDWCRRHAGVRHRLAELTGLVLSPHYLGPKLATLLEGDDSLRRRAADGELLLGTLETWLIWNWSGGAHRTDPTMAARTLLFDLHAGGWSDELLHLFEVPRHVLAEIAPSSGRTLPLPGRGRLTATLADQASGVLAAGGERDGTALVNFGTGTFVLRPTRDVTHRPSGYLAGPARVSEDGGTLFALEGPVNGGAAAVDRHGPGPTPLPRRDPSPDAFCLPDSAGIGAPHWRADVPLTFSESARALSLPDRRRIVLEGLLFRVAEILRDLFPDGSAHSIVLSGGLVNDPFLPEGLAACLDRPVTVSEEREGTLLGVARLAAGRDGTEPARGHVVAPGKRGAYLRGKRARWSAWVGGVLASVEPGES